MKLIRGLLRFCADEYGVGSIYMICLFPLFLILAGLGMDGAAAFRTRDMLQSTADAVATAAALRLPVSGPASVAQKDSATAAAFVYAKLNMSVAGFGNVLNLNADNNGDIAYGSWDGTTFTSPAPNGASENAVQITVKTAAANANAYPTSFLALVGKTSWDIAARAVAINGKPVPLCILALGSLLYHGGSKTDLKGCSIAVNGPMDCKGQPIGAGFALSTAPKPAGNPECGVTNRYNQLPAPDPYAALASNIPANPCGAAAASYPQEPALPVSNQWQGGAAWPPGVKLVNGAHVMCGDVQLLGDVTINSGETLVIENGRLDVGSHTLKTANGGSLSIIFSGPTIAGLSPTHSLTGTSSGTLDISAPSTGVWNQVAVYQDPNLTSGTFDVIEGGQGANSGPNWNITGIVYMPLATFQINGLVSPASSNPTACFLLVANVIEVSGGGDILAEGGCVSPPTTLAPVSLLVQ
jgi:Flp pilus assembly protein TadG